MTKWKRNASGMLLAAVALCGCSARYIRKSALDDLAAGRYETAMAKTQDGLRRYPESAELQATGLRIREEAISRLLFEAADARARGDAAIGQADVARAQAIAPSDARVLRAKERFDLDEREAAALDQIPGLLEQGRVQQAAAVLRPFVLEDGQNARVREAQRRVDARMYQEVVAVAQLPDTRPVTLEFRDAAVRQVFEGLSRETKINFVLDKDVRPDMRVTVFAHRVSLERALELILNTNQLARKMIDESTVIIYPNTPEKVHEYEDLVVRSFFVSHADAKQVAGALKSVLKLREPYVDERMNLIVLRDGLQQIEAAEKLISVLDQGEPEVMLDVAVLEVNSSRLLDLGIQFPDTFSLTPLPPSGASGLTVGNIAGLGRNRIGLGLGAATINLQSQDSDATVLANPRIRAKNREKAHILIGDKYPVITSSAAPTAGFVSENITYIDVGIKVDFEPLIGLDGDVTIRLNLEVSSIANQVKTSSGSIAYQIGTRSAGTTLRLQDGETQILGGLISRNDTASASRLPGLGDLPIAGRLFSSQTEQADRTEVLLSITPHIISNVQRPDAATGAFYSGTEGTVKLHSADRPAVSVARGAVGAGGAGVDGAWGSTAQGAQAEKSAGSSNSQALRVAEPQAVPAGREQAATPAPVPAAIPDGVAVLATAPESAQVGDVVEVTLTANISAPLRALPISLNFDAKQLRLETFERGALLGDARDVSVAHSVDQAAGSINLAIVANGEKGISGAGALGVLRFTVLQPGSAAVQLAKATPMGMAGPVPAPRLPDAVRIRTP